MILKRNQSGEQYLRYFTCCIMQTCIEHNFKRMLKIKTEVSNIMHRVNGKCSDVVSLVVGR